MGLLFFSAALTLCLGTVVLELRTWRARRSAGNVKFDHRIVGCSRRYRP
jgi:hypothetical protein